MQYFSTNRTSPHVSFREATMKGQPDDKGLYFPSSIPKLSSDFLGNFRDRPNDEIAFEIIRPFVGGCIPEDELFRICKETVDFPFPLVPITGRISSLELFHGPTLAFKDVGARFMSRCLRFFSRERFGKTIVIVATSGDTGGAVANGFHGVEGIEVVILYPKGKVSRVQEQQLTTLGGNVTALEVLGTFDDCQAIAKQALADTELQKNVFLTSANSINIARWLPQQFYYFYALKQWDGEPPVFSVPSGNFGNICAGILANVSGMPAKSFIAACNANDAVTRYLQTGVLKPQPAVQTLSNAMDVGNPSNFVRILELFGREFNCVKENLTAVSISDETTSNTMRDVFDECGYLLDPHGAVAFAALSEFLQDRPGDRGIILETAHPIKFDSVEDIVGDHGAVPEAVTSLQNKPKRSTEIGTDYESVREILLGKI